MNDASRSKIIELLLSILDFRGLVDLERLVIFKKRRAMEIEIKSGNLALPLEIEVEIARKGNKIDAIKLYRARTKHGLRDSKDVIEFFMRDPRSLREFQEK